jgi:nucleoside-diphosphate-sugar epimerase
MTKGYVDKVSKGKRIAVTGASSFIGVHLVEALLKSDVKVHALTRDLSDEAKVGPLKALKETGKLEIVSADVNDFASLEKAFAGCDGVMHLAVPHPQHGGKPILNDTEKDELLNTACQGARTCFEAAKKAGVKKVVYTSSLAAVECGNEGALDESCWSSEAVYGAEENKNTNHFQYIAAKTRSEKEAWKAAEANGIDITVICPGNLVIGDILTNHINGTVQHIADICNGKNTLAHHADIAPVNVKDVCAVHVAAMFQNAASGKRYLCAPYMKGTPDFIRMIKEVSPNAVEPPVKAPQEKVIVGTWGKVRSTSNKLSELGINSFTSLENTVKTCVDFLMTKGYIEEKLQ